MYVNIEEQALNSFKLYYFPVKIMNASNAVCGLMNVSQHSAKVKNITA